LRAPCGVREGQSKVESHARHIHVDHNEQSLHADHDEQSI